MKACSNSTDHGGRSGEVLEVPTAGEGSHPRGEATSLWFTMKLSLWLPNPSQGGQYCRITPLEEGVAPAHRPTICDAPLYAVPLPPYSLEVRFQTVWGERHRIFQGRAYSRVTGRCHPPFPEGTFFMPSEG